MVIQLINYLLDTSDGLYIAGDEEDRYGITNSVRRY